MSFICLWQLNSVFNYNRCCWFVYLVKWCMEALKPWPRKLLDDCLLAPGLSCNLSLSWPVCRCFFVFCFFVLWAGLMWLFSVLLCFRLSVVAAVSNSDACWGIKLLLGCSSLSNISFYSTSLFIRYFLAAHLPKVKIAHG